MAYFDSKGVQIYYEEHGKGEPVVLVHGFASRAEHNWGADWFDHLGAHYRVVALDCRGHGKSAKPHEPEAYAGETMGDDVIRLMDHLGIRRTLLMGYSMGGRIALGLLRSHPERLRAVVLGGIGAVSARRPSFSRQPIVNALLAENDFRRQRRTRKAVPPVCRNHRQRSESIGGVHGRKSRRPDRRGFDREANSRTDYDRYWNEGHAGRRSQTVARFNSR